MKTAAKYIYVMENDRFDHQAQVYSSLEAASSDFDKNYAPNFQLTEEDCSVEELKREFLASCKRIRWA